MNGASYGHTCSFSSLAISCSLDSCNAVCLDFVSSNCSLNSAVERRGCGDRDQSMLLLMNAAASIRQNMADGCSTRQLNEVGSHTASHPLTFV